MKSTTTEIAPGSDVSSVASFEFSDSESDTSSMTSKRASLTDIEIEQLMQPYKINLEAQKRDEQFRAQFRLPVSEHLIQSFQVLVVHTNNRIEKNTKAEIRYYGTLSISENYLTFHISEEEDDYYEFVMPLYTIRRAEKLSEEGNPIKIVSWHHSEFIFYLSQVYYYISAVRRVIYNKYIY